MDMEYRYTAGQNDGRIAQAKDWVSGEEVSYAYDSLQRLISAEEGSRDSHGAVSLPCLTRSRRSIALNCEPTARGGASHEQKRHRSMTVAAPLLKGGGTTGPEWGNAFSYDGL
jgi:hypothetical protein